MTEQEAIDEVLRQINCGYVDFSMPYDEECVRIIKDSIQKQNPMKISKSEYRHDYDWTCNKCEITYHYRRYTEPKPRYCEYCGQKLDWT